MIKTATKAMRVRQGVLKAKVYLKQATPRQAEYYDALVRLYGTSWTAGKVAQKIINAEERKLVQEVVDALEDLLIILTEKGV